MNARAALEAITEYISIQESFAGDDATLAATSPEAALDAVAAKFKLALSEN